MTNHSTTRQTSTASAKKCLATSSTWRTLLLMLLLFSFKRCFCLCLRLNFFIKTNGFFCFFSIFLLCFSFVVSLFLFFFLFIAGTGTMVLLDWTLSNATTHSWTLGRRWPRCRLHSPARPAPHLASTSTLRAARTTTTVSVCACQDWFTMSYFCFFFVFFFFSFFLSRSQRLN